MSYDDLSRIVTKARQLIATANAAVDKKEEHELLLEGDGASLQLSNDFSRAAFAGAPPVSYSVEYSYGNWAGSPICCVELHLSDVDRHLNVSGASQEQVDAVFTAIHAELRSREGGLGGMAFRITGGGILLSIGLVLSLLSVVYPKVRLKLSALGLVITAMVFLVPWRSLFAGTAVYAGDASFVVRNGPEISAWSLVLSVVFFCHRNLVSAAKSLRSDQT